MYLGPPFQVWNGRGPRHFQQQLIPRLSSGRFYEVAVRYQLSRFSCYTWFSGFHVDVQTTPAESQALFLAHAALRRWEALPTMTGFNAAWACELSDLFGRPMREFGTSLLLGSGLPKRRYSCCGGPVGAAGGDGDGCGCGGSGGGPAGAGDGIGALLVAAVAVVAVLFVEVVVVARADDGNGYGGMLQRP